MMCSPKLILNEIVIMILKTGQHVVFFAVFVFLSFFVGSGAGVAQNAYPDLLDEDVTEFDYLDKDYLNAEADLVIRDPLEPMNRVFFEFNDVLYVWVLKPVTNVYMWFLPLELRQAFGNFFLNLSMPVRLLNSLLQGDLEKSGIVLERFLINSTLGVYGFADIADVEFGIKRKRADFGQTLGKWGLGEGIYFCWPVFGPSNVRDTVGLVVDSYSHPVPYLLDNSTINTTYFTTNRVNSLSLNPDAYEDLKRYSVDPYVASRQAYYEYRQAIVTHH